MVTLSLKKTGERKEICERSIAPSKSKPEVNGAAPEASRSTLQHFRHTLPKQIHGIDLVKLPKNRGTGRSLIIWIARTARESDPHSRNSCFATFIDILNIVFYFSTDAEAMNSGEGGAIGAESEIDVAFLRGVRGSGSGIVDDVDVEDLKDAKEDGSQGWQAAPG